MAKSVSIKQIAKLAGCSTATVSHVLNNKGFFSAATREKVLKLVREHNYIVNFTAKSLRTGASETIGLIFYKTNSDLFKNDFYLPILNVLQSKLCQLGYDLLLADFSDELIERGVPPSVISKGKADGIILLGGFPENALKILSSINRPVVALDAMSDMFDCVFSNNSDSVSSLVDTLVKLGHRRLAFIRRSYRDANTLLRAAGFSTAVKRNNLKPQDCPLIDDVKSIDDACMALEKLLKSANAPTAVIGSNDDLACALMRHAVELGYRVPEDVSFVGYDNTRTAAIATPPLSTMNVHRTDMAELCAAAIVERIRNPQAPRLKREFPTEFIMRSSIAAPKH